jgi:MFS family permease
LETPLSSPTTDKEDSVRGPAVSQQPGRLLQALLGNRAIEAIRFREFRLLWVGQALTGMATWMDQVARGWLMYELTNSPVQLGLVRGIQAIPILLLSPLAGTAADRYDRKTQVIIAQVMDMVMYATMAWLIFTGRIQPWHVYVTAIGTSTAQSFQHPSRAAMVADSVPTSHLTNAIGLNSISFNVCRSTGPALAGMLIAMVGTGSSYAVQAAFYLLATMATIRICPTSLSSDDSLRRAARKVSFGRSIVEGWKFSWNNENVRIGLLITTLASLFIIPFSTLLPVFAKDVLGVGATGQGLLLTAMGIGALSSSVLIASLGDRLPRGIVMLGGVVLYGISVIAFSLSPWFKLSFPLMILVGLFHVASHALVQTVVQSYSSSEFRGRVMSLYHQTHFVHTMGSVLIGTLASLWGAQLAVGSMAAMGALSMVIIHVTIPRARLIQ